MSAPELTSVPTSRGTLAPLPTPVPPTRADLVLADTLFPAEAVGQLW